MGCIVFQILMSAKIQTPATKSYAITLMGVSIAIVRRDTKVMGWKTEQVVSFQSANPRLPLLHYVST